MKWNRIFLALCMHVLCISGCSDRSEGGEKAPAPVAATPREDPAPPVRVSRSGTLSQADALQIIRTAIEKQTGYKVQSIQTLIHQQVPAPGSTDGPVFSLQGFDFILGD